MKLSDQNDSWAGIPAFPGLLLQKSIPQEKYQASYCVVCGLLVPSGNSEDFVGYDGQGVHGHCAEKAVELPDSDVRKKNFYDLIVTDKMICGNCNQKPDSSRYFPAKH